MNMGMRSWTLQQNLVHFMFLRNRIPSDQKIRRIVLFSGYNELNCMFSSRYNTRPFGNIYGWSGYFRNMNHQFIEDATNEFSFPAPVEDFVRPVESLDEAGGFLREDFEMIFSNWKLFADSLRAEVTFALQPILAWLDKSLSAEEKELLDERAGILPEEAAVFKKEKETYEEWYGGFLRDLAGRFGFEFIDLNVEFKRRRGDVDGRWLYVDPWHLTDAGNELVSEILNARIRK